MGLHLIAAAMALAVPGLSPPRQLAGAIAGPAHPALAFLGDAALLAHADGEGIRLRFLGEDASLPVVAGPASTVGPALAVGPLGEVLISYPAPDPGSAGEWSLWLVARTAGGFGEPQLIAGALPEPAPQALVLRSRGGFSIAWERTGPPGETGIHLSLDGSSAFLTPGEAPRLAEDEAGFLLVAYLRGGRVFYRSERDDLRLGVERELPLPLAATGLDVAIGAGGSLHFLCATAGDLLHAALGEPPLVEPVPGSSGATGARLSLLSDGTLGIVFFRDGRLHFGTRGASFGAVGPVPDSSGARSMALGAGLPAEETGSGFFIIVFDTEQGLYLTSDAPPPMARFTAPASSVTQGEEVAFEDLSTGAIFDRRWDFGDGTTHRGPRPRHRYRRPGSYRVTLEVSGPSGTSSFALDPPLRVEPAANLLRFPAVVARPGDRDLRVPGLLTHAEPASGFQAVFRVAAALETGDVIFQGTRTQLLEPELLSVDRFPEPDGTVVAIAALWDYLFPFDGRLLPAGDDQALFLMDLSVPADAVPGATAPLTFLAEYGPQAKSSLMVTATGQSLFPSIVDGVVVIVSGAGRAFVRGDANGDRHVDISDAIWTLEFLFLGGKEPRCHDAADKNDDGVLDVSDPIDLLHYLFAGGMVFPAYPYPTPGFDGTEDSLPPCE